MLPGGHSSSPWPLLWASRCRGVPRGELFFKFASCHGNHRVYASVEDGKQPHIGRTTNPCASQVRALSRLQGISMAYRTAAAAFAVLLGSSVSPARAQTVCTGPHVATLNGTVHDSTDALVPGAKLVLDSGQEVTSGADGRFRLPCIHNGTHKLTVTAEGFSPREMTVRLPGSELDVVLQLATVAVNVTVNELPEMTWPAEGEEKPMSACVEDIKAARRTARLFGRGSMFATSRRRGRESGGKDERQEARDEVKLKDDFVFAIVVFSRMNNVRRWLRFIVCCWGSTDRRGQLFSPPYWHCLVLLQY